MSPCMERRPSEVTRPPATPPSTLWPPTFPECPERITPSTPRSPSPASLVTVRWTEVTTLTPRPSARLSTSALLTAPEVWPSTASSAPTELSSTRTTSSATGGSTLTAPPPRTSTASMMRSLPKETLWPGPLTRPSTEHPQSTARPRLLSETMTPASEVTRTPGERPGGFPATGEAQAGEEGAEEAMEGEGKLNLIDRDLEIWRAFSKRVTTQDTIILVQPLAAIKHRL